MLQQSVRPLLTADVLTAHNREGGGGGGGEGESGGRGEEEEGSKLDRIFRKLDSITPSTNLDISVCVQGYRVLVFHTDSFCFHVILCPLYMNSG